MKSLLLSAVLSLCSLAAWAQKVEQFPYPSVPDTLREPDARASWLVRHYWDDFNFADTAFFARSESAEQGFVNFVDLLPRVSPAVAACGLVQLVGHMYSGADAVRERFMSFAASYLGDESSPMRDDVLYAQFLEAVAGCKLSSLAERTRCEYLSRNLRKNVPGTPATDFGYADSRGIRRSLYSFRSPYTLLYFFDPDCRHCREVQTRLISAPQLAGSRAVRVLAIRLGGMVEEGRAPACVHFPESWTCGSVPADDTAFADAYYIRSMPSLYLLDRDKRVMLKNPGIDSLLAVIEEIGRSKP